MNEEQINAARAAFQRDPETACQALLGCSSEELFVEALRGCNQHKHKPGCPEANGGGVNSGDFERILKSYEAKSPEARKQEREAQLKRTLRDYEHAVGESASDSEVEKLWKDHTDTEALYNSLDERLAKKERGRGSEGDAPIKKSNNDVYWLYNNSDGKMEPVSEDEMNDFIDQGLTTATITSDENGLTIEAGEDKRTLKFGSEKNAKEDLSRQREFIAKAFGSFNWERDGKQVYDDDALDKVIKMAKHNKSVSLAVFGDWED